MSYYDEYKDCKRCGLIGSRFYQYNLYNSEEDDSCMVCGNSRRIILTEEKDKSEYKEIQSEGFGSIHIHYKSGINKIILLEKTLEKHEIKYLKEALSKEHIDKDNSSVMIWDEELSELKVLFGKDLREVYVENKLDEEYFFKEIEDNEVCI